MAEVNKEELRRWCNVEGLDEWFEFGDLLINDVDGEPRSLNEEDERWIVAADPRRILPLLDENAAQASRIAELEAACKKAEQVINRECQAAAAYHMQAIGLSFELEACRKDAMRYRWIRERAWYVDRAAYVYEIDHVRVAGFKEAVAYDADDVEAAIDAAMQEGGV